MNKIVFVCTGNTCRSAMAEFIFKSLLKKNGINDYKVSSCGLSVVEEFMSPLAREALRNLRIKTARFKPKQFNKRLLDRQNAIICMSDFHRQQLLGFSNVYTIDELSGCGDISDPYGGNISDYEHIARLLIDACEKIMKIILEF